jgi:FKBP-type peptidyl-prolyl cis-trans isomerase
MAIKRSQRIAIWVIAVILTLGTLGSFLVMILANDNLQTSQQRLEQLMAEYQTAYTAYEEKVAAQNDQLTKKYYAEFSKYKNRASKFSASDVTELKTVDLKKGTGEEITAESSFSAYYIGWNPTGKIFDSSIEDGTKKLRSPLPVGPGSVIEGWLKGVVGMKVGGIREITIPSDLAYGETGSGELIPPNTPIKFVVMIIPTPETIEQPQPSEELLKLYSNSV